MHIDFPRCKSDPRSGIWSIPQLTADRSPELPMLPYVHIGSKGGKQTFAALTTDVWEPDKAAIAGPWFNDCFQEQTGLLFGLGRASASGLRAMACLVL